MATNGAKILVLTVGTGNIDSIEKTLLVPLRKSIATDAWKAVVVLLPSTVTASFAHRLRKELGGVDIEIHPLPEGDENDADRAYAHFDQVLTALLQRASPEQIEVDFTRGTKAILGGRVKSGHLWTPQIRPFPASRDGSLRFTSWRPVLARSATPDHARRAHAPTARRASGVKASTAGTSPSRPGRKAHS